MGKSGSFFFFSHDNKFLIKTMTLGDFQAFKTLFRIYFEHVCTQTQSLLARIYGVYSVQIDEQEPVYLIMMGTSALCDNNYVRYKFDLKGSLVKRIVEERDIEKNTTILKDKNLLKIRKNHSILNFQVDEIQKIIK
mmetsp:Transcript_8448/g.12893  ORF Transcript_8448/g.12893 Transcript_8448/m.12893 type:complete len:136 (+) Transcript_8448:2578-2985(+)